MEILSFVTTPFAENAFVLKDGDEAIVIDPGEATDELLDALTGLTVRTLVNTHTHIDHVGGNAEIIAKTGAELVCHRDAVEMLEHVVQQGAMFGMEIAPSPAPTRLIEAGDVVKVGSQELTVVYVPGHAPGHIALVGDGFIIGGDVLFAGSVGRTDLPGGDMQVLMNSIQTEFLTLPDETIVYCGHGPSTTVGMERKTNPFIASL